ncbi:MAG: DUF5615 family PIN-like protein [Gemmatimonadaceae bacterium]
MSRVFVLDENISPAVAVALQTLDYPVRHCTEFLERGTKDEVLFLEVASRDYFLVTQDQNMSRKKHQRAAMVAQGLGVFIFTGKASKNNRELALLLQQAFDEMQSKAQHVARPFIFGISDRRHFDRHDTPRRRR